MQKKVIFSLTGLIAFALFTQAAAAQMPDPTSVSNPAGKTFSIPARAVEVSPGVFSLGSAVDPVTGNVVDGFAIVHKKEATAARQNNARSESSSCYAYLAKGAKWKTVENWVVNPQNTRGLDETTVFNTVNNAISKWEDATDGNVTNGLGVNVMGSGTSTADTLSADTVSPDGQNEAYFADIADPNTIGVTIVWGYFSGPTFARQLVEWDQVYDDVTFNWSTAGNVDKIDLDNVVTHEIGHSFGMADLYNTCTEETMYGYTGNGETKKRTLNTGDITGINNLY